MKRLKKWQAIVLVAVFLGSGGGVFGWRQNTTASRNATLPANTQLVAVQLGNVVNSVSASGTVSFPNKADLVFGVAGTVAQVNVKQGDAVTKGQSLAKVDDAALASLQKAVVQARIGLRSAEDDLAQARTPYTDSDISQAEASVENSKVAVRTAEDNLAKARDPYTPSDVAQAELAVVNAKVALATAQDNASQAVVPYSQSDIVDAEAAVTSARQQLSDAQTRARLDIADAEYAAWTAQDGYSTAENRYALGQISYEDLQKAARDVERAIFNLDVITRNASKTVQAAEDAVAEAQQTLSEMRAGPNPLDVEQKQMQMVVAEANLANAQHTLSEMRAGPDPLDVRQKQAQLAAARSALVEAEQALSERKAGPDALEVELGSLEVASARAALADAEAKLSNANMAAPFDAVVSAVNVKVGQSVTASTVAISIVDTSSPQIDAVVSEADVARVKQGQTANITLDSLPGVLVSGSLATVALSGKTSSGVVSYPVTVVVTPPQDAVLREGMTATVTIVVQQVSNVLVVPNRAIAGTTRSPTVTVIANGRSEVKAVTLGLADDSRTQVLSGLSEGEMVTVNTSDSSSSEFRYFGGAGIGGMIPGLR